MPKTQNISRLKVKEKIESITSNHERSGVVILISRQNELKTRNVTRNILIKNQYI
jgi:hypothetical protein